MKNIPTRKMAICLAISAAFLAIFITRAASAQDTIRKQSHKKIIMKVISDDNGKTTVIDTSFTVNDQAGLESLERKIRSGVKSGKCCDRDFFTIHSGPDDYSYDFKMPFPPECMKEFEKLKDLEGFEGLEDLDQAGEFNLEIPGCGHGDDGAWEMPEPGCSPRFMQPGQGGQSLNDLLGEIPMDRVIGYSIKDRKHGKRITIDLDEGPVFERHPKVVVIRDPGHGGSRKGYPQKSMKIYINHGEGDHKDSQEPQEDSKDKSPKPSGKDNSDPGKPKI